MRENDLFSIVLELTIDLDASFTDDDNDDDDDSFASYVALVATADAVPDSICFIS